MDTPVTPQTRQKQPWLQVIDTLSNIVSSLYAMLMVAAYIALTSAWIVRFPAKIHQLQGRQFLVYLLLMSVVFLVYILVYLTKTNTEDVRTWPNHRSHGSAFLRQGAIVFGLGTLVYATLEFISFFQVLPESACYDIVHPIVFFLFAVFTILQVLTIVRYPRLNINKFPLVAKFGLMHLVTTNAIIWIHTTVKESINELVEAEEQELEYFETREEEGLESETKSESCTVMYMKKLVEEHHNDCKQDKYFNNFLGDTLQTASPFLFAFIIEFTLIGATVFFTTWAHVGPPPTEPVDKKLHKPKPRAYISNTDWSHSLAGFLLGLFLAIINFVNLGVFFHMASTEESGDEFLSKATNIVINILGIAACILGIIRIQNLGEKQEEEENSLDLSMLNISGFFMFFYACLTIIVGFNAPEHPNQRHPSELIIINGIVEILYVTLQITFLVNLLQKSSKAEHCTSSCNGWMDGCKPGRQAVMFLILLNISQWIIATFELQKSLASPWEKNFYGFLPWVILQRMSLPLCVFFRFHSAVIAIDCWKNAYKIE